MIPFQPGPVAQTAVPVLHCVVELWMMAVAMWLRSSPIAQVWGHRHPMAQLLAEWGGL
jgi:hypothetical protein